MGSISRCLRGAVVGAGQVALEAHLPGWQRAGVARIVAGTDRDPSRQPPFRAAVPGARWHDTFEGLLEREELEFVDICTPPAAHFGLIRQALEHGLHVLCEKPLVLDPVSLDRLSDLARGKARTVQTVHNWHQAPILRQIHALLRRGLIGGVHRCTWHTLRTRPAGDGMETARSWRMDPEISGGGILLDHGWHALYVVNALVGRTASHVSARLETRRHLRWPVEDTATVQLTYPGARADLFLTWAGEARANRLVLEGSRGSITVEDATVTLRDRDGRERVWTCADSLSVGSYHPDWFAGVARGFAGACEGGGAGNLAEARACVVLINLAQASSRSGGEPVAVPARAAAPRTRGSRRRPWPVDGAADPRSGVETRDCAVIIVADAAGAGGGGGQMILGLPLLRRSVLAARAAGIEEILVLTRDVAATRARLENDPVRVLSLADPAPGTRCARLIVLGPAVLASTTWFRRRAAAGGADAGSLVAPGTAAIIDDVEPAEVVAWLAEGSDQDGDPLAGIARHLSGPGGAPDPDGLWSVRGPSAVAAVEAALLRGLVKETEGFMSRHLERPISLAITRRLVNTGVTPNAMSVFSIAVGIAGAAFFLSTAARYQLTGALLFLAHSILDGCDGELARLTFRESRAGALLDFWGDNLVHGAVFICITAEWSLQAPADPWIWLIGVAAVGGSLGSAGYVYWHVLRRPRHDGPLFTSVSNSSRGRLTGVMDALTRRDFIYLVVLLAAFGKSNWFVGLAAVGAPVFLLLLVWIGHQEGRGCASRGEP